MRKIVDKLSAGPVTWPYLVPITGSATAAKIGLLDSSFGVLAMLGSLLFFIPYYFAISPQQMVFDQYKVPEELPVPWARILGPPVAFFVGLIGLPSSGIPPEITQPVLLAAGTAAGTYSTHLVSTRPLRGMRHHARKLVAATDLADITVSRLEAMDRHRALAARLIRIGAFDGTRVRVSNLSPDYEAILAAGIDLEKHGLASVSSLMHPNDRSKWWLELTALGVQVFYSKR